VVELGQVISPITIHGPRHYLGRAIRARTTLSEATAAAQKRTRLPSHGLTWIENWLWHTQWHRLSGEWYDGNLRQWGHHDRFWPRHHGGCHLGHRRMQARRTIEMRERDWGYDGLTCRFGTCECAFLTAKLWCVAEGVREYADRWGRLGLFLCDGR
jgi:hypothetical protein